MSRDNQRPHTDKDDTTQTVGADKKDKDRLISLVKLETERSIHIIQTLLTIITDTDNKIGTIHITPKIIIMAMVTIMAIFFLLNL